MRRRAGALSAVGLAAASTLAFNLPATASASMPSTPTINNWSCVPAPAHPYPVVLIHGTGDSTAAWNKLSAALTAHGYCVYGLNDGQWITTLWSINGMAPVAVSAGQVSTLIDQVRKATGASKVDIVAHSQGGMIGEYLAKNMHLASEIHREVLLAPVTHGTTLNGIVHYSDYLLRLPDAALWVACPACADMEQGSAFVQQLDQGPIAQPGVDYTVLETRNDTTVTPPASTFIQEPGVANHWVQDSCPSDKVGHAGMPKDPVVDQMVLNVLGTGSVGTPDCSLG